VHWCLISLCLLHILCLCVSISRYHVEIIDDTESRNATNSCEKNVAAVRAYLVFSQNFHCKTVFFPSKCSLQDIVNNRLVIRKARFLTETNLATKRLSTTPLSLRGKN
jgi:hypothetical protein